MTLRATTRRRFLGQVAALSAAAIVTPRAAAICAEERPGASWLAMREDPARLLMTGPPHLDETLALYPRLTGEPAFDPELIRRKAKELQTTPAVNTGHPFWDLPVKTGFAALPARQAGCGLLPPVPTRRCPGCAAAGKVTRQTW
ncbi:MAG: hypothetical protein KJZ87_01685 [Thermoguttaceae bacterium]|nr:hypothetical protein [Thermoguttaceae bacterium]